MRGINLAKQPLNATINKSFNSQTITPTIFLSHISEDIASVKQIGEYILNAGFDIYLDIYDEKLRAAVKDGNPGVITKSIEEGIQNCSHVMCIVSEETINSWWVPYEIGFGKKAQKILSTLTLKNTVTLPPFLEITKLIRGTKSLNTYLDDLSRVGLNKSLLESASEYIQKNTNSKPNHPLDSYLDWKN